MTYAPNLTPSPRGVGFILAPLRGLSKFGKSVPGACQVLLRPACAKVRHTSLTAKTVSNRKKVMVGGFFESQAHIQFTQRTRIKRKLYSLRAPLTRIFSTGTRWGERHRPLWGTRRNGREEMKDRWTELCESAVSEPDLGKFRAILRELNQLLDERGFVPSKRQRQWPHLRRKFERENRQSTK
jgi:hypothetical protein